VTSSEAEALKDAIRRLHRTKDAAYGDAWKKRGEVMSIMANIARKADRLEYATAGAPASHDESLFDTAVDLLVYSLKYQTYLADQDPRVATSLFGATGMTAPYSNGPSGFETLLSALDMTSLDRADGLAGADPTQAVLTAFADLETCFEGASAPNDRRAERAGALTRAAVTLLIALSSEMPDHYRGFVATEFGRAS
jgi:hypothetical protein